MAKSRKRPRAWQDPEVRRIRDRFNLALRYGHPTHEAARLAEGHDPIPTPGSKPPPPPAPPPTPLPQPAAVETVKLEGRPAVPAGAPTPASADQIPPNWQDLPWSQLKELAAGLAGRPVRSRADAGDAIRRVLGESGQASQT